MAELLLGKPVADGIDLRTIENVNVCKNKGVDPCLAIVRVGERADDLSYERGATSRCEKNQILLKKVVLPEDVDQETLISEINKLNKDSSVHGILMFKPLPKHLDENAACEAILPAKDVDGITKGSMAAVFADSKDGFPPCTAQAVIEILKHYNIEMTGKRAVVIGRSLVIGKPVSMLLLKENATVTVCHSRTSDMPSVTKEADILVTALGRGEMIDSRYVTENQKIIDVGINWSEEKNKLVGDINFDDVEPQVSALTPVPRGVGSVTTAVLVSHVVEAALRTIS